MNVKDFTKMTEGLIEALRKENPGVWNISLNENQIHIFGDKVSRGKLILPRGFFQGPQTEVDGNPEFTIRTPLGVTQSGHKIFKSYVVIFNR